MNLAASLGQCEIPNHFLRLGPQVTPLPPNNLIPECLDGGVAEPKDSCMIWADANSAVSQACGHIISEYTLDTRLALQGAGLEEGGPCRGMVGRLPLLLLMTVPTRECGPCPATRLTLRKAWNPDFHMKFPHFKILAMVFFQHTM